MSICHALVDLIDGISQSLDAKKYSVALDTVNYQLLCKKWNFLVSAEWHISG